MERLERIREILYSDEKTNSEKIQEIRQVFEVNNAFADVNATEIYGGFVLPNWTVVKELPKEDFAGVVIGEIVSDKNYRHFLALVPKVALCQAEDVPCFCKNYTEGGVWHGYCFLPKAEHLRRGMKLTDMAEFLENEHGFWIQNDDGSLACWDAHTDTVSDGGREAIICCAFAFELGSGPINYAEGKNIKLVE